MYTLIQTSIQRIQIVSTKKNYSILLKSLRESTIKKNNSKKTIIMLT